MADAKTGRTSLDKRGGAAKTRRKSASVIKPDCLALIEDFRLMDDTFMSKCLENATECIELMLRIIIGKEDLKVVIVVDVISAKCLAQSSQSLQS